MTRRGFLAKTLKTFAGAVVLGAVPAAVPHLVHCGQDFGKAYPVPLTKAQWVGLDERVMLKLRPLFLSRLEKFILNNTVFTEAGES